jgi:hypothetical protein
MSITRLESLTSSRSHLQHRRIVVDDHEPRAAGRRGRAQANGPARRCKGLAAVHEPGRVGAGIALGGGKGGGHVRHLAQGVPFPVCWSEEAFAQAESRT